MKRSAQRSAEEWSSLVASYQSGEEDEGVFCARHGMKVSTFRKWRYRMGGKQTYVGAATAPLQRTDFIEVVPSASSGGETITLRLGDDVRMDYPMSGGMETLARLVLALRRGC